MIIKLLNNTVLLLLICASWSAVAKDISTEESSWYSIEYIVFKNNVTDNQNLEPWTKEPFVHPIKVGVNTTEPVIKNTVQYLSSNQKQLHGAYNRLKRIAAFTPLKHGGWIQEAKEKAPLSPTYIKKNINGDALEGTLTFHRERFLHLDLDLQLSQNTLATNTTSLIINLTEPQQTNIYRLQQTRRIKTAELHYFDHPQFGVIAKIEKIDAPIDTDKTTELINSLPLPEQSPAPFPVKSITQ